MSHNQCSTHGCSSHTKSCGCGSHVCSCGSHGECSCRCHSTCSCHSHDHHGDESHFSKELIEMADKAWMCLLAEKMKAKIQEAQGARLEELAKLVVDSNEKRWQAKMAAKKCCHDFDARVEQFFSQK